MVMSLLVWVLETKLRFSPRMANDLYHQTISPVPPPPHPFVRLVLPVMRVKSLNEIPSDNTGMGSNVRK